ncbi:MAG: hypothetical protein ACRD4R_11735 [Candidatus Acidiferrales bacterium]
MKEHVSIRDDKGESLGEFDEVRFTPRVGEIVVTRGKKYVVQGVEHLMDAFTGEAHRVLVSVKRTK